MAIRSKWRFIGLLHNLPLEKPIDTEHMAIVPMSDPRLRKDMSDRNFRHFVTSFRDQFGRKRQPSALVARGAVRRKPASVLAFRNAVTVSAVTRAWVNFLGFGRDLEYFRYSGYFDLYPHYLSADYKGLIVRSPLVLGYDLTSEFRGQTAPELPPPSGTREILDTRLFEALIQRWRRRHVRGGTSLVLEDEALFRSLEMAYRAARVPSDNRGSLDDYGASLALWVSAMEILVWPKRGGATVSDVLAALRPAMICSRKLQRNRFMTQVPRVGRRSVSLMEKLYCEIYRARNSFLHGNRVTDRSVHPSGYRTRLSLLCYAPLLYRCVLYTLLDLWTCKHDPMTMEAARHRVLLSAVSEAFFTATRRYDRGVRRQRVRASMRSLAVSP